jgi:hypothetical protein
MKNPKEEPKQKKCIYCNNKGYIDNHTGSARIDCLNCDTAKEPKQETIENPVIIVRNDDKEEFIHLSNGMYRSKWGVLNNSVSNIPLKAFDKTKFTFYYE